MGEYFRHMKVGLVGDWPEGAAEALTRKLDEYDHSFDITGKVRALRSEILPDGFERLKEVEIAQEIGIAGECNVVVYGNSGMWGAIKRLHMKELQRRVGVLVVWTPHDVEDDIPDEDKMVPGYVQVAGRISLLAKVIAYLFQGCMYGEVATMVEAGSPDETPPNAEEGWG